MKISKPTLFARLLALSLATLMAAACGNKDPQSKIAELEKKFREGTEGGTVSLSSTEMRGLMTELADAYVAYADANPGDVQSAEYLYKAGEILETNLVNPRKALELYQRIQSEYPESERAADALFKRGFIYNNDNQVKDLEKAEAAYQAFIATYPDHHLRDDAEKELEFLGLSDEELLQRLQQANPPAGTPDSTAQADPS